MDIWLSRIRQGIDLFLSNGWYCVIVAIVLLIWAFFSMRDRQSSAGTWGIVILAAALIMIGLGQITGLGFGMSF